METKTYVVVGVGAAGIAALAAFVLAQRKSATGLVNTPQVVNDVGALEDIVVTAQRLAPPTDERPRGIRNNNPLNLIYLRANAYNGQTGNDGEYGVYATAALGLRAGALELKNDYTRKGLTTIDALITEWAPPSSNPTAAYISAVSRDMSTPKSVNLVLNRATWFKLMRAMIRVENGGDYYTDAEINQSLTDAGITQ